MLYILDFFFAVMLILNRKGCFSCQLSQVNPLHTLLADNLTIYFCFQNGSRVMEEKPSTQCIKQHQQPMGLKNHQFTPCQLHSTADHKNSQRYTLLQKKIQF